MSDLGVFKSSEFNLNPRVLGENMAGFAGHSGPELYLGDVDKLAKISLGADKAFKKAFGLGDSVAGSIETLTVSSDDALDRQVGGDHYKSAPIQQVEFCERNGLSGLESAVVKRIWRHRRGGKGLQDLQKAAHEIELLIKFHYSE